MSGPATGINVDTTQQIQSSQPQQSSAAPPPDTTTAVVQSTQQPQTTTQPPPTQPVSTTAPPQTTTNNAPQTSNGPPPVDSTTNPPTSVSLPLNPATTATTTALPGFSTASKAGVSNYPSTGAAQSLDGGSSSSASGTSGNGSSSNNSNGNNSTSTNTGMIVGISVGVGAFVLIVIGIIWWRNLSKAKSKRYNLDDLMPSSSGTNAASTRPFAERPLPKNPVVPNATEEPAQTSGQQPSGGPFLVSETQQQYMGQQTPQHYYQYMTPEQQQQYQQQYYAQYYNQPGYYQQGYAMNQGELTANSTTSPADPQNGALGFQERASPSSESAPAIPSKDRSSFLNTGYQAGASSQYSSTDRSFHSGQGALPEGLTEKDILQRQQQQQQQQQQQSHEQRTPYEPSTPDALPLKQRIMDIDVGASSEQGEDPSSWNVDQVVKWAASQGCGVPEIVDVLRDQEIDGRSLLLLSNDDMRKVMPSDGLDYARFEAALDRLRASVEHAKLNRPPTYK